MINFASKWDDIDHTSRASVLIRVAVDHKLNLFVGYSGNGKRQLKLRSNSAVFQGPELPEFENIETHLGEVTGMSELCITLIDNSLKDLFSAIATDLVIASSKSDTEAGAAQIFANRLGRWADLLKERKKRGLTFAEQLGLLGELYFLDWIISREYVSYNTAVTGWRGPDGDSRDVNLGHLSVEIKATLGTGKRVLKISSLDQLDTEERNLIVAFCTFSPSKQGFSLAKLVEKFETALTGSLPDLNDFRRKLYLVGYDSTDDYKDKTYEVLNHKFYVVREGFPRLTPGRVPPAIRSAKYEITCNMLTDFEIDEAWLEAAINGER